MKDKTTTIRVSESTKKILDNVRHEGQSYDGLLRELVDAGERLEAHKKLLREHEERIRKLEGR